MMSCLLGACASTTSLQEPATASKRNALSHSWSETPAATVALTRAPVAIEPVRLTPLILLEDSLHPGAVVNLNEPLAQTDLWVRMRGGFSMQDLDNDGVRRAEAWYSARPDYVQRMTERGGRYLYHIIEEVEKRGMPSELALLPFIESAFNPQAMSTAKAAGMWQFVPATGRDFDLKQNIFGDDRRDVLASTRAALDYLEKLNKKFGDWHLALAAYNWGQGNVQKAIERNQRAGLPTDYESLRMPDETRYYIPKLQAVKNIVLAPQNYALELPPMANHPYFLSVGIDRDMDVDVAARLAGISPEAFKQFNPQMNKPVMLAARMTQVLLPYDNASAFVTNLAAHRGPLATWTAWVVPRTMNSAEAARQVGMDETALREINLIPPRMLVKQGSTLLVLRAAHRMDDVSEHLADNASMSLAPDRPPAPKLRQLSLRAGKADTVASVAARYRVSVAQVAQWNKVGSQARFKAGQKIVVYMPAEAPRRVAVVKAPNKSAKAGRATGGRAVIAATVKKSNVARQMQKR